MTGGSLPAMTWHTIMAYAHEGAELKQLPGVAVPQVRQQPVVAETKSKSSVPPPAPRPALLTKRGADALVRVVRLMDDANRALGPARPTVSRVKDKQAEAPHAGGAFASSLEGRAFGNHN
jgi:penicillin-binding protein 1A